MGLRGAKEVLFLMVLRYRTAKRVLTLNGYEKNVIVDGQAIEIPIKLKELPKDWTYETSANRFAEDRCHVEVKDKNGDLLFNCGAENYKESKKGDSRIFDAPLRMTNVRLTA